MMDIDVSGRDAHPEPYEKPSVKPSETSPPAPAGMVLPLDDPHAGSATLTGGKAAALARAAASGLPVLPGFVVLPPGPDRPRRATDLHRVWRELSRNGARPLVVRSSSAAEDTAESSMAGRFDSVLDVLGWDAFRAALAAVRASAVRETAGRLDADGPEPAPAMAVLVQPMVRSRVGGVLFSADPVAGRTDRFLVSVVRGGPDRLVGGAQQGTTLHLSPHGRLLHTADPEAAERLLRPAELRRLAALARRAAHVFGGPQDIEFGFDERTGTLWLFQSRPITAMAPRPERRARLLGPGPVAETLPGVLQPLEEDLWVVPMAHGLALALDLAGAAPRGRLRAVPVVSTVEGRAVADLTLLGVAPRRHRLLAALNPLPGVRRLSAAWRMGRLHGSLPGLATALAADVDRELTEAPPPTELSTAALASTLRWSRAVLVSLHAQEALAGTLALPARETLPEADAAGGDPASGPAAASPGRAGAIAARGDFGRGGRRADSAAGGGGTAAGCGLAALRGGRAAGLSDDRIVATTPEVLALVPPSLTEPVRLPAAGAAASGPPTGTGEDGTGRLSAREALRLRIRWVQEFQARLVRELAYRVGARTGAPLGDRVVLLRWAELVGAAEGGPLPNDLGARRPRPTGAPLPDAFRLAEGGLVVAEPAAGRPDGDGAGQGVSGGRVTGTVWDGTGPRPADPVLVVRTLDPALAALLPSLTGLVAQTGSPLSHLAVLAREIRLATVTGAAGAVDRFPPGTRIVVDGSSGEVTEARDAVVAPARDALVGEARR